MGSPHVADAGNWCLFWEGKLGYAEFLLVSFCFGAYLDVTILMLKYVAVSFGGFPRCCCLPLASSEFIPSVVSAWYLLVGAEC